MITMNNILKGAFIFTIGAAVGSLITYDFINKKDEVFVEVDGEQVANGISSNNQSEIKEEILNEDDTLYKITETYKTSIDETVNYSDMYKKDEEADEKDEEIDKKVDIHEIDPREYGWDVDYTFSFTLFADGILSDEMDDKIQNPESRIGSEILKEFIDSDSDEIYIRNEKTKSDYEIVKDERRYSDVYCS